jgi:predicted transcriptional regulator
MIPRETKSWVANGLSPLGNEILLNLEGEPKDLGDLRAQINARDTSILHTMKKLESDSLVYRDSITRSYSLTNIGHVYAITLNRLLKTSNVMSGMSDFWLQHDLSGIPDHLLLEIGALDDATILRSTPSDLDAIHSRFLESLRRSMKIDGISAVFHPDFIQAMADVLDNGAKVRIVLTREVFDKTREIVRLKDLAKYVKRLLIDRNLEIYIGGDPKMGLTATENFVSLGLFTLNGAYDYAVDIMSSQPQALEWGERLFGYYRGISERIGLSSIL